MKKIIYIVLLVLMASFVDAKINKYIYDCKDLQSMEDHLTWNYTLARDIDCSDTVNWVWEDGQGFRPIGLTREYPFFGNFFGDNHTISNLYINVDLDCYSSSTNDYYGLFGHTRNNTIQNVGLENVNFTLKYRYTWTGGLVGYTKGTTIKQVYVKGYILSSGTQAGGVIGYHDASRISDSYFSGNLILDDTCPISRVLGGFVSRSLNAYVNNSYSYGNITELGSPFNMGGFVGQEMGHKTEDCFSLTNLTCTGCGILGGFVGSTHSSTDDIINVYNGNLSTQYDCIGQNQGGTVTCTNITNPIYFNNYNNSPISEWDFDNVWSLSKNKTAPPILKWEENKKINIRNRFFSDSAIHRIRLFSNSSVVRIRHLIPQFKWSGM